MVVSFDLETSIGSGSNTALFRVMVSPDYQHILVGSSCGRIFVYSLATSPPLYCSSLQTPVTAFDADWSAGLLFTVHEKESDGKIWRLSNKGNNEWGFEEAHTFKTGPSVLQINFYPERNELFLGTSNGTLLVLSLRVKTDGPICNQS